MRGEGGPEAAPVDFDRGAPPARDGRARPPPPDSVGAQARQRGRAAEGQAHGAVPALLGAAVRRDLPEVRGRPKPDKAVRGVQALRAARPDSSRRGRDRRRAGEAAARRAGRVPAHRGPPAVRAAAQAARAEVRGHERVPRRQGPRRVAAGA